MPKISLTCPACDRQPGRLYKCPACGEIRCGSPSCTGSSQTLAWWAASGTLCRNCQKGRYFTISDAHFWNEVAHARHAVKQGGQTDLAKGQARFHTVRYN
ncbi:MAG: hypothetical protein HQL50_07570 [Magnetococcales bacterium]|nr:hypothetical protein [Magnetococcales bacterium]